VDYKKRDEIKGKLTKVLREHKQQEDNKLLDLCRDIDNYISKGHTNKEAIEYTIDRYGNK